MKTSTFAAITILAIWAVLLFSMTIKLRERVENLTRQVESLQKRVPVTFKNTFSSDEKPITTIKVAGMLLKNSKEYKQSEATNIIAYRKHLCESLGGTYSEDFNTDQYYTSIPGYYNGLREGAVYECSRVEPIFLAN